MGSWGYGPTENDAAQDWLDYHVCLPIYNEIRKTVFEYTDDYECEIVPEEVICAINLFVALQVPSSIGICFDCSINELAKTDNFIDLAVRVLEGLLQNQAWVEDWGDSEIITQEMSNLILSLKSI